MKNQIYHKDCLEGMKTIPNESINCVLTDPPYLYLKNQKLDRPFDEKLFFSEVKRILKKDGFIVIFGRGTSFYRWNCLLADLGFVFKEEIVWNKNLTSSPVLPISRVHETIAIYTKDSGIINNVKVDYIEQRRGDIKNIINNIKRVQSAFNGKKEIKYLETLILGIRTDFSVSTNFSRYKTTLQTKEQGLRCVRALSSICNGMKEKSIINISRQHYSTIHPTQKPVRLLERLLNLVTVEGDIVLDPFSGSASTAIACLNTGRESIGYEIDEEYFEKGQIRLNEAILKHETNHQK